MLTQAAPNPNPNPRPTPQPPPLSWPAHPGLPNHRHSRDTRKAASVSGQPRTREARIELSTKVLDRPERLRSTLAHEMCHAAAWLVDGDSRPPHGDAFRRWATKVQRHAKLEVTTCHRYEIAFKYTYVCTNATCGAVYGRHSQSVDVRPGRWVGTPEHAHANGPLIFLVSHDTIAVANVAVRPLPCAPGTARRQGWRRRAQGKRYGRIILRSVRPCTRP